MPLIATSFRTLPARPALVIRSHIERPQIAATIAASLGRIVPYVMEAGGTLAGQPFARYPEFSGGSLTIEVGMPVSTPLAGRGDIESFSLPAGLAAMGLHAGNYTTLPQSCAELAQWVATQGRAPAGPLWEVYVSDPGELPDPADWRTEIYLPVN